MNYFEERIVVTGVGLTSPLGDDLVSLRENLLAGRSGVTRFPVRNMGDLPAGVCEFETTRHQSRKQLRVGTRAGSIGIYCAHEAFANAGIEPAEVDRSRIGVYVGITEHGNFEDHSHPEPLKNLNVLSIVDPNLTDADKALLASARKKMDAVRAKRIRPHLDDKILSSWNGLMLGAVARASQAIEGAPGVEALVKAGLRELSA